MAKLKRTNNYCGTSFYGLRLNATPNELISALGDPHYEDNSVDEKTSLEWDFETEDGLVFTIYDWKEYDAPASLHRDKKYYFHIGVKDSLDHADVIKILAEYNLQLGY